MFQFPRNHFLVKPVRLLSWGRFTRSNFFIQLFFSPLFKTTIGCVNASFSQVSDIFYVLDENRTCSISIWLDQKSRQFSIFPRSILQNIFTKWAATAGPSCDEMGLNSQNKNCRVSLEYITIELDGKIGLCERQHFSLYKKSWNDNWTKTGSCESTFMQSFIHFWDTW